MKRHLADIYNKFNKLYFEGKLPPIAIRWKSTKRPGFRVMGNLMSIVKKGSNKRIGWEIWISPKYRNSVFVNVILIHEMIHFHLGIRGLGFTHGKHFKAERKRLFELGAYDEYL